VLSLTFTGVCISQFMTKVRVTREYVYCSKWGKDKEPGVWINKIKKGEKINLNDKQKLDSLFEYYTVDSSFSYSFYHEKFKGNKIYFNKPNTVGNWRLIYNSETLDEMVKVIGKLELDTWYVLSDVLNERVHFVYVQKNGKTKVFERVIYGPW
jgi:hypothetical protein